MKTIRISPHLFTGLIAILIMSSCDSNLTTPPDSLDGPYPPAPENLSVAVRGGLVELTWTITDSTIRNFTVYRQDGARGPAVAIGQSTETHFVDTRIVAGNWDYGYSVSGVSEDGYEGRRSEVRYIIVSSEVFLFAVVPVDTFPAAFRLSWTASLDSANFAAYQLYRSLTSDVDLSSTPIATITGRTTLSHVDRGLQPDTDYSYRVYVFNRSGNSAPSNIVTVRTAPDAPPLPVSLALPAADSSGLRLSWSRSTAVDFASYRIFRSTQSPVEMISPVSIINEMTTTSYTDRDVARGVRYYYRVAVYDHADLFTGSNEVSGMVR